MTAGWRGIVLTEDGQTLLDGAPVGEGGFADAVRTLAAHAVQFDRRVLVRFEDQTPGGETTWFSVDVAGELSAATPPSPDSTAPLVEMPTIRPAPLAGPFASDSAFVSASAPSSGIADVARRRARVRLVWQITILSVAYVIEAALLSFIVWGSLTLIASSGSDSAAPDLSSRSSLSDPREA